MKRTAPIVIALAVGMVFGYLIGSDKAANVITPTLPNSGPPVGSRAAADRHGVPAEADAALREESERRGREIESLRLENERLRSRSPGDGTIGPAGTRQSRRPETADRAPVIRFPVVADGTENPVRIAGASEDPATGVLRVLVTKRDGTGLPGVEVKASFYGSGGRQERKATTDSHGWAAISSLRPARYNVAAAFPVATQATTGPERFAYRNASAQVLAGRVTEVSMPCRPEGTLVTGRVIDSKGKTYGGALVSIRRTDAFISDSLYGRATKDGRYQVADVPAGRFEMKASGGGVPYSRGPLAEITILGEGTLEMDLVVDRFTKASGLTGTVRDAATGKTIGGVRISESGGTYALAVTNGEGRYELKGLGPGTYRLSASKDGYAFRWLEDVSVKAEASILDIELHPAAVIHLRVTDREGRPAVGRLLLGFVPRADDGQRLGTSVLTDDQGRATYRQGLVGDYELRLSMEGVGSATMTRTLRVGEQTVEACLES